MPNNSQTTTLRLSFSDEAKTTMLDFALFFAYFNEVYRRAEKTSEVRELSRNPALGEAQEVWINISARVHNTGAHFDWLDKEGSELQQLRQRQTLEIVAMSKNSPSWVDIKGSTKAIVLAVVLGGGSISWSKGEANLPNFGDTIIHLEDAVKHGVDIVREEIQQHTDEDNDQHLEQGL